MDLLPILAGQAPVERTLFWRTQTQKAVRRGDWKLLIEGNAAYLFNLRLDIGENDDLARDRIDLIRSLRPPDFETPVSLFNSFITPNDLFYVRSHLPIPQVDAASWALKIGGEVDSPLTLSLDAELASLAPLQYA